MSVKLKKSGGRNTRNSQRLYNLQQQEELYKKLGISAMTSKEKPLPEEEEEEEDSGERSLSESEKVEKEETPPKEEGGSGKKNSNKKAKNLKRPHQISSNSDSDREKPLVKKKKKKRSLQRSKKARLSGSPASFSPGRAADGFGKNLGPINFPKNLMAQSGDSDLVSAHMQAYTRYLLENNLLLGQTIPPPQQPQQLPGPSNSGFSQAGRQANLSSLDNFLQPSGSNQGQPQPGLSMHNNQKNFLDDSSLDGNSNADPGEVLNLMSNQPSINFLPQLLQQPAQKAPHVAPNVSEEVLLSQACDAEKEVDQDEDNAVGPEVSEQLMSMLKNFLGRSKKAAKIDDLEEEFLRPKNLPFLKSPKIEDEIYLDLSGQAKHFDKNCRGLQGYLSAGMTALMRCIQMLIELEKVHPKITQAGLLAKKALQLMAFTNREINDRRKDALKVAVNPEYLPLLKHAKPPSEDWLLGGSLNDSIKQCDESKKLTEKIMKSRKNINNQQEPQQGFQQNQFTSPSRQKYRNRGNRREFKNSSTFSYNPRQQWQNTAQSYQQPLYHQQYLAWPQQLQNNDPANQQVYQQATNQFYPAQQTQTFYPQYNQNQQLGFHQAQQSKNYPQHQQQQQQFQQKKKN